MKIMQEDTKFAHLGKPGSAFTPGFKRRFDIITDLVDFKDKKILDLGCGEGVWLAKFAEYTDPKNVYGSEFDYDQVKKLKKDPPKVYPAREHTTGIKEYRKEQYIHPENIINCPGEALTFDDNFFDIVFQNEVLEHVQDDEKTLKESLRVLKPGGKLIFFTPNRGWPFEQHGMFLKGKYYWGNIPLLPWMPAPIYKKFAPHVRNYSWHVLRKKIKSAGGKVIYHTRIFPGFDKMTAKYGPAGKFVKDALHSAEKTPLKFFGISHLVIVEKKVD